MTWMEMRASDCSGGDLIALRFRSRNENGYDQRQGLNTLPKKRRIFGWLTHHFKASFSLAERLLARPLAWPVYKQNRF